MEEELCGSPTVRVRHCGKDAWRPARVTFFEEMIELA